MIKALLVDDEQINNQNLSALLSKHCPEIFVVGSARSADEAIDSIQTLRPDLVFLDIEMPGKSGFDLLRGLPDANFEVIFVTAYDSYGIMAIKFSAIDYLLKPINIEELRQSVLRARNSIALKENNHKLSNLLGLLDRKQRDDQEKIALPTQKETFLVPVREIVRCASSNNYTTFYLADGTEHLISRPLYEYEAMLEPYNFLRCHQSHLVNPAHIISILNEDSGYLLMRTDAKVPISKQRKALVKERLLKGR